MNNAALKDTIKYLTKNYHKPVFIDQLTQVAKASERNLNKDFHQSFGVTPLQWLWLFRTIVAAEIIMMAPWLPLREVANKSGFTDMRHFIKCFYNLLGQNPSDFRHKHLAVRNVESREDAATAQKLETIKDASIKNALEKIMGITKGA